MADRCASTKGARDVVRRHALAGSSDVEHVVIVDAGNRLRIIDPINDSTFRDCYRGLTS